MSLYDELEVSPNASTDVIQGAYRSLAKRFHPDRNPGDPSAAVRMRRVNDAYAVLGNPAKRADYDATQERSARSQAAEAKHQARERSGAKTRNHSASDADVRPPRAADRAPSTQPTGTKQTTGQTYYPPGWYPDPGDPSRTRWWNGQAWMVFTDPPEPPPRPQPGSNQPGGCLASILVSAFIATVLVLGRLATNSTPQTPPPTVETVTRPPTPRPTPTTMSYTVRSGDSWSSIATIFELQPTALCALNNASLDTTIHPGDLVTVPFRAPDGTQTSLPANRPPQSDTVWNVWDTQLDSTLSVPLAEVRNGVLSGKFIGLKGQRYPFHYRGKLVYAAPEHLLSAFKAWDRPATDAERRSFEREGLE